jgi:hypothetical protein
MSGGIAVHTTASTDHGRWLPSVAAVTTLAP